jgi:hypothetical protein
VHTAVLADGHKSSSYVEKIDINCWEKLEDISFVFYSETCLNQMSFWPKFCVLDRQVLIHVKLTRIAYIETLFYCILIFFFLHYKFSFSILHFVGVRGQLLFRIIWSSRPRYWYYNTGNTSILPVSAILVQILVSQYLPEFSSICNTRRYWSLPNYEDCRHRKILGILVIPVLQILEDSGKYW